MRENESPEGFIDTFAPHFVKWRDPDFIPRDGKKRQTPEDRLYHAAVGTNLQPKTLDDVKDYLAQMSWLQKRFYKTIHDLVAADKIGLAIMGLDDKERTAALAGWVQGNGFHAGHIYVSSTFQFIQPHARHSYHAKKNNKNAFEDSLSALTQLGDAATNILWSKNAQPTFVLSSDPLHEFINIQRASAARKGGIETAHYVAVCKGNATWLKLQPSRYAGMYDADIVPNFKLDDELKGDILDFLRKKPEVHMTAEMINIKGKVVFLIDREPAESDPYMERLNKGLEKIMVEYFGREKGGR